MVYILFGTVLWLIGRQTSGYTGVSEIEIARNISGGFVSLPAWLYLLCGKPINENLPEKVVSARSLMTQIAGILFVVYGCYSEYSNKPAEITNPESFIVPLILGVSLGYLLKKLRPFQQ